MARSKEQDRERKRQERKLRSHSQVDRKAWLKKAYGITPDTYTEMFNHQEGYCLICQRHQLEFNYHLCVDHCHTTGKIRGLLCKDCNQALGLLKDDTDRLRKAIMYLEQYQ